MKSFHRSIVAFLIVATFGTFFWSLGNQNYHFQNTVDLISLHKVADKIAETGEIDFLSDQRYRILGHNWSFPITGKDGFPVIAAIRRHCSIQFNVIKPAHRWLSFKAALSGSFGSLANQTINISIQGKRLQTISLNDSSPKKFLIKIPRRYQTYGNNYLRLTFSNYVANPKFTYRAFDNEKSNPYPGVAAYFSELNIYLGNARKPWLNEIHNSNRSFRFRPKNRTLIQRANSELNYSFRTAPRSKLKFSGTVESPPRKKEILTLSIRSRTEKSLPWTFRWEKSFSCGMGETSQTFEGEVSIPSETDDIIELSFRVEAQNRPERLFVRWNTLRLTSQKNRMVNKRKSLEPLLQSKSAENLVIILLDAARWDYFGCYGDNRGITPKIDEFARSAILFKNAVAAAPYTLASVSSLFSGLTPEKHGVRDLGNYFFAEINSLPKFLKNKGFFNIALTGNWANTTNFGLTQDFDETVRIWHYDEEPFGPSTVDMEAIEEGIKKAADSGKRSFIFIHLLPPHWPYNPPPPFDASFYVAKSKNLTLSLVDLDRLLEYGIIRKNHEWIRDLNGRYINNLHYADNETGRIINILKKHGLFDNSIIIVTADHGEAFGEHGRIGHDTTVFNEMIRVPLILKHPYIKESKVIPTQVGLIDIFPTAIDLLGLDLENELDIDGQSLFPLMFRNQPIVNYYYSRAFGPRKIFSLTGDRYKYISSVSSEFLFDLKLDPLEQNNIVSKHPALASLLRQKGMMTFIFDNNIQDAHIKRNSLDDEEERTLRNLGYIQ